MGSPPQSSGAARPRPVIITATPRTASLPHPPGLTENPSPARMKAHHDGTTPIPSDMGGRPRTPRADLAGRGGLHGGRGPPGPAPRRLVDPGRPRGAPRPRPP